MAKSGISFSPDLDKLFKNAKSEAIKIAQQEAQVDIECPKCATTFTAQSGKNICPSCDSTINFNFRLK